jgi:putative phage-type endonuclease
MIRLTCPQRSAEWYAARAGLLCASDAGDAFPKTPGATQRDLILSIAVEQITHEAENGGSFVNADMQRGIDLEPRARAAYEAQTGDLVEIVDFCRHDTLAIGCSPDGFVGDDGMLEIKCPRKANHLLTMREGKLPEKYRLQCLHQLLVTGRVWVDFVSYCDGLPDFIPACWVTRYTPTADALAEYQAKVEKFLAEVDRERAALLGWKALTGGRG